ncbi:MAG TPA: hypothetical protein ENK21_01855 [Trueperaceae bacterium]|nr:hypothetical protein [Trueperaceae bacterium]
MKRILIYFLICLSFALAQSPTLERIKEHNELNCGVSGLQAGSFVELVDGGLIGFSAEFCRAIAVAILDSSQNVIYIPLNGQSQFPSITSGDSDILVGDISLSAIRDIALSIEFGPAYFHKDDKHYAPVIAEGDSDWKEIVSWLIFALIQAEEWGLNSDNIDGPVEGETNLVRRDLFANYEAGLSKQIGLEPNSLSRMIRAVGNYGEIYDRHFGSQALVSTPRGLNDIWQNGGMLYAPPFSTSP